MIRRITRARKHSLTTQDILILDTLAKRGAATPLQVEVRAGLFSVDVARRIERLKRMGLVISHISAYGNDRATHNIYTLSPKGRENLRQRNLYIRSSKGNQVRSVDQGRIKALPKINNLD